MTRIVNCNNRNKIEKKKIQNRMNYLNRKDRAFSRVEDRLKQFKNFLLQVVTILLPKQGIGLIAAFIRQFDSLEKVAVLAVILMITLFSVRDTVAFLSSTEPDRIGAWLKAISCEGIVLLFSWITFKSIPMKVLKVITLASVFIYSFYTTSGTGLFSASQSFRESSLIDEEILDIRQDIQSKKEAKASYLKTERLTAARQVDKRIDELQDRLSSLRSKASQMTATTVIQIDSAMKTLFRLTALLANILLTHYLALLFQVSQPALETVAAKRRKTKGSKELRGRSSLLTNTNEIQSTQKDLFPHIVPFRKNVPQLFLIPQD